MKTINTNFSIFDSYNQIIETVNNFNISSTDITSKEIPLNVGGVVNVFDGSVLLAHDTTTMYSLTYQTGNTYRLNYDSGKDPIFRTSYSHSGDNTSTFSLSKVGKTMVIEHTGGTVPNFVSGGFVVGGEVEISNNFSSLNNGIFVILNVTETKLVLDNPNAIDGTFTLTSNSDINGFSSTGVQVGDTLTLGSPFVTSGKYEITKVTNKYLEFTSILSLPNEGPLNYSPGMVTISDKSIKMVYVKGNGSLKITLDGVSFNVNNLVGSDGTVYPGYFFITGLFTQLSVEKLSGQNDSIKIVTVG